MVLRFFEEGKKELANIHLPRISTHTYTIRSSRVLDLLRLAAISAIRTKATFSGVYSFDGGSAEKFCSRFAETWSSFSCG